MQRFADGDCALLVATTVVEVGVDVPSARIMVIEDAQRFGLAQLHQLRGRVGRSAEASGCVLLYRPPLSAIAQARLKIMRTSHDGFAIAEEDLRLRGPGEVLGARQSGDSEFIHADLAHHYDLLLLAQDQAESVIAQDPTLREEKHQPLRILLALYDHLQAVAYLGRG